MMQMEKEIPEILREAAAAVADSDIPEDLRSVAFEKAVDLIAGAQTAANTGEKMEPDPNSEQQNARRGDNRLGMIADKFGIEVNVIEEAFRVDDGIPQLTIPPSKLDNSKSAATKQIALLIAAARQATEVEEWTNMEPIRESVEDCGKYDMPNFARAISNLNDDFSVSGKGKSKTVKVRRNGFENAGALVMQMLGKNEK